MIPVRNFTPKEFVDTLIQEGTLTLESGTRLIVRPITNMDGGVLSVIQHLFSIANYQVCFSESGVLGEERTCEVLEDGIQITIAEGGRLELSARPCEDRPIVAHVLLRTMVTLDQTEFRLQAGRPIIFKNVSDADLQALDGRAIEWFFDAVKKIIPDNTKFVTEIVSGGGTADIHTLTNPNEVHFTFPTDVVFTKAESITFSSAQAFCDRMLTGKPLTIFPELPLTVHGANSDLFKRADFIRQEYLLHFLINRLLLPTGKAIKYAKVQQPKLSVLTDQRLAVSGPDPITIQLSNTAPIITDLADLFARLQTARERSITLTQKCYIAHTNAEITACIKPSDLDGINARLRDLMLERAPRGYRPTISVNGLTKYTNAIPNIFLSSPRCLIIAPADETFSMTFHLRSAKDAILQIINAHPKKDEVKAGLLDYDYTAIQWVLFQIFLPIPRDESMTLFHHPLYDEGVIASYEELTSSRAYQSNLQKIMADPKKNRQFYELVDMGQEELACFGENKARYCKEVQLVWTKLIELTNRESQGGPFGAVSIKEAKEALEEDDARSSTSSG